MPTARDHRSRFPPSRGAVAARLAALGLIGALSLAVATQDPPPAAEHMVAMRDGVRLATSVYVPEGEGPWPAIVTRTPYNKAGYGRRSGRYTDHGYAFVVQDCRGRFASQGDYEPYQTDLEDGYDTVEWVAKQPFSNGRIGISGRSAMGIAANLAAAAAPPSLDAAYVVTAPESLFDESYFMGGVFREHFRGNFMRLQGVGDQIPAMKARAVLDEQWLRTDLIHHRDRIRIPMYQVGGWYDMFARGAVRNFQVLQHYGRLGARGKQKLWMGPWAHSRLDGDLEYPGARGLAGAFAEELRWFDYWLRDIDDGIMDEPAVTYYHLAAAREGEASALNGLRRADDWPPPCPQAGACGDDRWLLLAGGGLAREETLTAEQKRVGLSRYTSDPRNPVPTHGGANYDNFPDRFPITVGPVDQRIIGEREDYLRFHSAALEDDYTVQGNVRVELWIFSDAPDTDFMVKLVDVYPDGYQALVLDTALRARYREGRRPEDVTLLEQGVPALLELDLWDVSLTFERGHRLGVHVSSTNAPRFEVNPQTGAPPGSLGGEVRTAANAILHGPRHGSALIVRRAPAPD